MTLLQGIYIVVGLVSGLLIGLYIIRMGAFDENAQKQRAEKKVVDARAEGQVLVMRAREKVSEAKKNFEFDEKQTVLQIERSEKLLEHKVLTCQKREARVKEIQLDVENEEKSAKVLTAQATEMEAQLATRLAQIAQIDRAAAREELISRYEMEYANDGELRIQRSVEGAQESATREAKDALTEAICRYADNASRSSYSATVKIMHDDVKGRIVGRGGRMIGYFEELFGVDVVFNDEPNLIIVSCFNLVQQETARLALVRLVRERNITEEVILRIKNLATLDMQKVLQIEGERIFKLLGLTGLPAEFAQLTGRLKFRTSYGQNVLRHCAEVGYFAKLLAADIGADENIAFLGGFFHDIGKAIDQEVGGSHDVLTKEILEKYGFSWEITHAAWTHHNAIPQETVEARIVQAADAISAGRPGARAESAERYIERIRDLEDMALSFTGVKKVYAINAGREVRVIVEPDKIADAGVVPLAEGIAAKIQEKGGYPGKIRVLAVRSTKATNHARTGPVSRGRA